MSIFYSYAIIKLSILVHVSLMSNTMYSDIMYLELILLDGIMYHVLLDLSDHC